MSELTTAFPHHFEPGDVILIGESSRIVTRVDSCTTMRVHNNTWWRRLYWRVRLFLRKLRP